MSTVSQWQLWYSNSWVTSIWLLFLSNLGFSISLDMGSFSQEKMPALVMGESENQKANDTLCSPVSCHG